MTASAAHSAKQQFLAVYEREHQTTMKVLRAYPTDRLDLRPHDKCRTARELAWVFVIERGLGKAVFNDQLEQLMEGGAPPEPPSSMNEILVALETAHKDFATMVASTPDEDMSKKVRFFTGPAKMGEITRMEWCWFLLHDEIHHRGQFSIYLRMADGKVPSIYGPTGDEPWM
jgi:uncharacterized damage-inducible protein DinB